ncbi:MAG: hypothetical protein GWO24_29310 [Akkermansiaceae bacterium]|nr:hypothetical protein [Akkermansiaceae bacterium]
MGTKRHQCVAILLTLFLGVGGCSDRRQPEGQRSWSRVIGSELRALGYRNWIVLGDAAFPVHSRPGVRTILINDEIPAVLDEVLKELERVQTVTPRIYMSRELAEIPNDRAPGVDDYREVVERALRGYPVREMEFRSLSLLLEDSANKFTVLVFKTTTALPYSGVFIELDSGYWDRESERDLRERLEKKRRLEST